MIKASPVSIVAGRGQADLATMCNSAPDRRFVSLSWGDLRHRRARARAAALTDFITARRLDSRWA